MKNSITKGRIKYLLIIIGWITAWAILSKFINNSLLMVSPIKVVITLLKKWQDINFWTSVLMSLQKIALGFFAGATVGIVMAVISYRFLIFEEIFKIPVAFFKAAPVASFTVLFLIWYGSSFLSTAICACVVFPQFYVNILQGLKSTDKKLLEMADVFFLHPIDKMNYIYRPALTVSVIGAIKISAGMAWKSGIAAEVIGTPKHSIGEGLYMSKIHLDTAGVLSWTLMVMLLSMLAEKLLVLIYEKYVEYPFKCFGALNSLTRYTKIDDLLTKQKAKESCSVKNNTAIELKNISKSFGQTKVLQNYSNTFESGKEYVLDWKSGGGKTTLLRIIAGLENTEVGSVFVNGKKAFIFQEDRLCENYSSVINVSLACGDREKAKNILLKLLDEKDIYKPVKELSGGQKRRVAIARACSAGGSIVLADEPYNGLDEDSRQKAYNLLKESVGNGILIIASHTAVY